MRRFSDRVKSAILGGSFAGLYDFLVPMDSQNGSIFDKKCIFFEVWNFDDFRMKREAKKGTHDKGGWASGREDSAELVLEDDD